MSTFEQTRGAVAPTRRLRLAGREVALVSGVFALYEGGRHLAQSRDSRAFQDADDVLRLEHGLPLPPELTVQAWLLHSDKLVRLANDFYVSVHFPATVAFLVYLFVRRPAAYRWARSLLVGTTLLALVVHVSFPLAPPRMLTDRGFVDTMSVYGPSAYGEGTQTLTNQLAAMPSLHAAWAIVVGVVLVYALPHRWRWLFVLHPVLTVLVVVGTANHYWLDVLAGGGLVLVVMLVVHPPSRSAPVRLDLT